jgi:hypothetical protein
MRLSIYASVFGLAAALLFGCANEQVKSSPASEPTKGKRKYTPEEQRVFTTIQHCDSQLFAAVFNTCDSTLAYLLISTDLEFYHDKSGITQTGHSFI